MQKTHLNIVITPQDNFDGKHFYKDLSDIKELVITLPETMAPFNRGHDKDGKNIKNFNCFIESCLTETIEAITIINYWPMNPASAFIELDPKINAPNLKVFDFGFLGYNIIESTYGQNILDILGAGFLRGTQFGWTTRNHISDIIDLNMAVEYSGMSFNVDWEGNDLEDYISTLLQREKSQDDY